MSDTAEHPTGLLLSDDFLFNSRITGTAKDLGLTVKTARTAPALQTLAEQQSPCCVLIDLSNPGLNISELVAALRAAGGTMPYLVAFGSHVDTATLKAARDAGCDVVLPRSAFVEELPRKMQDWFADKSP
jgi:CheY-like chemotaxis protein